MAKQIITLDIECFQNYFLVMIKPLGKPATQRVEMLNGTHLGMSFEELFNVLEESTVVTFNGNHYDIPMLMVAEGGADCEKLFKVSNEIIKGGLNPWVVQRKYKYSSPLFDHIDLFEVAPGKASLKLYGGRIHTPTMQDLPYDPTTLVNIESATELLHYCMNDLVLTESLYLKLEKQIALRQQMSEEYGVDLRSKSDAQIAEAVISKRVGEMIGRDIKKPSFSGLNFRYVPPEWLSFTTPMMQHAFDVACSEVIYVGDSGKPALPKRISDLEIEFSGLGYQMGVGGLHSTEKVTCHRASDNWMLIDRDVTSYYPEIIRNCKLFPKHMGTAFLHVYSDIVDRRLEAKAAGDKVVADALKITINGSFGKFGSKYSKLFAPQLLVQTTLTGQLALLMLIEMIDGEDGMYAVSGNTDGVVIACHVDSYDRLNDIVWVWECVTGFNTEETRYTMLASRDVNNYFAVKEGGGIKRKGVYADPGLSKNATATICSDAVAELLEHGTPIEETIEGCTDMSKFVAIRTVRGGAVDQDGEYLGKAVRWYYSTEQDEPLRYVVNNNKVPTTDGAQACMKMPKEIPADLDTQWYINTARGMVKEIGYA